MTPDDFPTPDLYHEYLKECELSLGETYQAHMKPATCYAYRCSLPQPCPEHPDGGPDGIQTVYYMGTFDSSHCTAPMFKLKPNVDGCAKNPEQCAHCNPKNEKAFWEQLISARRVHRWDMFGDLNDETGLKRESHPDYELSVKVSHP